MSRIVRTVGEHVGASGIDPLPDGRRGAGLCAHETEQLLEISLSDPPSTHY